LNFEDLQFDSEQIKNLTLIEIGTLLRRGGNWLKGYDGTALPPSNSLHGLQSRLVSEELNYDRASLEIKNVALIGKLNREKSACDAIVLSVANLAN
jgi:hypothetical protein